MEQQQIDVVGLELPERDFDGLERLFVAVVFQPDLGGDEQLLSVDAAGLDAVAHLGLVEVGLCGVYVAVAGFDGVGDAARGVVLGDLEDAEAELGHVDDIAQGDGFHGFCLSLYS